MADQNITFKVTVNSKEAEVAFRKLADAQGATISQSQKMASTGNQSNMMLMSTSRIVQDLPFGFMAVGNNITFMVEQMAMARAQGTGMNAMLRGMLASLAGPMGIVFAISTLTSVLTMVAMSSRGAKQELDKFNLDSLIGDVNLFEKSLRKVRQELSGLTFDELIKTIDTLRQKLNEASSEMANMVAKAAILSTAPGGGLIAKIFGGSPEDINAAVSNYLKFFATLKEAEGQIIAPGIIPRLKADIKKLNEDLDRANTPAEIKRIVTEIASLEKQLNAFLGKSPIDKITNSIEKQSKSVGFLSVMFDRYIQTLDKLSKTQPTGKGFQPAGLVPTPDKPIPNTFVSEAELKEYDAFLYTTMTATAQSVGNLFKGMWREIFGEANNLLTDFIGNIVSALADLAARQLATSLLNFIFPGAGTAADVALGSQVSSSTPSAKGDLQKSTNIYNINIGDQKVAQVVTEGYNTAVRLRKL